MRLSRYTQRRSAPEPVPLSEEVMLHEIAQHERRCPSVTPYEDLCPWGRAVILVCGRCGEALVMFVRRSLDLCEHAARARRGERW